MNEGDFHGKASDLPPRIPGESKFFLSITSLRFDPIEGKLDLRTSLRFEYAAEIPPRIAYFVVKMEQSMASAMILNMIHPN